MAAMIAMLANLPVPLQVIPGAQHVLRQWFSGRVHAYLCAVTATAFGRHWFAPEVLPDIESRLHAWLAPPVGSSTYLILFSPVDTAKVPETGLKALHFPQADAGEYLDGLSCLNTCWHEFQHILFIEAEKRGWKSSMWVHDWDRFRKPPRDELADHVYIESWAEYTIEWLDALLPDTSVLTGSRGGGFETLARAAAATERLSGPASVLHRRHFWARAHEAWLRFWPLARKIAPLPAALREEYRLITGLNLPTIGQVRDILRSGALTDADGQPLRVPVWVLGHGVSRPPIVICRLLNQEVKNETHRFIFSVRVLATLRLGEKNSPPLRRGTLEITPCFSVDTAGAAATHAPRYWLGAQHISLSSVAEPGLPESSTTPANPVNSASSEGLVHLMNSATSTSSESLIDSANSVSSTSLASSGDSVRSARMVSSASSASPPAAPAEVLRVALDDPATPAELTFCLEVTPGADLARTHAIGVDLWYADRPVRVFPGSSPLSASRRLAGTDSASSTAAAPGMRYYALTARTWFSRPPFRRSGPHINQKRQ
jgi:hypothetical protein